MRKKKIRLITIDGVEGIGKTTQANHLVVYLKEKGYNPILIDTDENLESALNNIHKSSDFLKKNDKNIVISDGSFGKIMVIDKLKGIPQRDILEQYKEVIHEYEVLAHKYGMLNLLMIMEEINICSKRVKKRERLLGNLSEGIIDIHKEKEIIDELKRLDNFVAFGNLKFDVFSVEPEDSILEIHSRCLELIKKRFEI